MKKVPDIKARTKRTIYSAQLSCWGVTKLINYSLTFYLEIEMLSHKNLFNLLKSPFSRELFRAKILEFVTSTAPTNVRCWKWRGRQPWVIAHGLMSFSLNICKPNLWLKSRQQLVIVHLLLIRDSPQHKWVGLLRYHKVIWACVLFKASGG